MAEEAEQSEKTEPPSPFKLLEAKKKGQIYKSQEVNSVMALTLIFILLVVVGSSFMSEVFSLCASLLKRSAQVTFTTNSLADMFAEIAISIAYIVSPIISLMMLGGVLSTILQTGLVFSTFPLKPDVKRMNPISGFKKIFSKRTLFELFKTIIKVSAFAIILFVILNALMPKLFSLSQKTVQSLIPFFVKEASFIIFQLLCVIVFIALIDFLFVRWEFMKNMRMSKKEMNDEHKRREGDPKIKQKRKEIQRQLLKKAQSMTSVSKADMVITNPTHYAVAIKYDIKTMIAPQLISKGRDLNALRIKEEAKKHNVEIFENPFLARKIYQDTEIGQGIPIIYYLAVAKLYRKLYLQRKYASEGRL